MIDTILTDIEGTTSSIAFVLQTLIPYAARHLRPYVRAHATEAEVRAQLDAVDAAAGRALALDEQIDLLEQWMAEDRKATPLKALQGMIWREGYDTGELTGDLYDEVPTVLRRWHESGKRLYVYSSGSEQAQRLLFKHSTAGDLTPLLSGYFDTRIGAKQDAAAYARLREAIGSDADATLFLSDISGELDAARAAGLRTCQLIRDDASAAVGHPHARDFDDVDRQLATL